ncbi:MAG: trypsin-like peptidase domain-containing protein [Oscillospiraceae bacterium]|nr:trypsin-like peptidase domain-containing protein [Oscillospiraceae bacterium]
MKKRVTVLLMTVTIGLSGVAGFGGAYIANILGSSNTSGSSDSNIDEGFSKRQIKEIVDEYVSGLELPNSGESTGTPGVSYINGSVEPSDLMPISEIAERCKDSVVEIYTESVSGGWRMGQYITEGAGSGVVFSEDGYIVTNNHVIEGARKITVRLNNGESYDAELIGRDSQTDLAVVKIKANGLKVVTLGDSDKLIVGELTVAIGNPLGHLGGSVSEGVISALSRNIEIDGHSMNLLQTTAAVNPGNSGGALFNGGGALIGIVNAKSSGADIEGIGFAIPVNLVKSITDDLIEYGYVLGRMDFGASLIDITDAWTAMMYNLHSIGVYVSQADSDSPLQIGDHIISINEKSVSSTADVSDILEEHKVGDVLKVKVERNNETLTVEVKIKQAIQD